MPAHPVRLLHLSHRGPGRVPHGIHIPARRIDEAKRGGFNALHRLDFPPFARLPGLPRLREGLITLRGLLGASLAGGGCVIGGRRLFHRRPPPA